MGNFLRMVLSLLVLAASLWLLDGCSRLEPLPVVEEAAKKVEKITYYGFSEWMGDPKYSGVYKEVASAFEKETPLFEIELRQDPWGTWEPKYKAMFAAGTAPDVLITNHSDFPVFANGQYLLDVGTRVGEEYLRDFFPGVLEMYAWNGKKMGIPFTTDGRVLWYNKGIFEKAGLDPEKPPKTWSELKEYAKKCTLDTDGDGKTDVYGFGMDLGLKEYPQQALFCASNGWAVKVGEDGSIAPNVNSPEFKGYLQLLADMKPYYEPDFVVLNHHKVGALFAQQKVAMAIGGTWIWEMNEGMAAATFYGQARIPKMDGNAPDGSFGGGFAICVNAGTQNPEEAVKFAQMLCDPAYNSRLMSDIPASRQGLAASPMAKDPRFETFMEQIASVRQAQPKTPFYSRIDAAVYESVTKVVLGLRGVEEGTAELEGNIKKILESGQQAGGKSQ